MLPDGPNTVDYAFVLVRARRGTSPSTQYLLPAGHVAVYPFFDIDHIQTTMELDSLHKIDQTLQSRCLQKFWPDIYAFPGSRRIPPGIPAEPPSFNRSRLLGCTDKMRSECASPALLPEARSILVPARYATAVAAGHVQAVKERCHWWLDPVLMLLAHRNNVKPCWRTADNTIAVSGLNERASMVQVR
jgi:hypothetical protein